jgi:hypothetical protein
MTSQSSGTGVCQECYEIAEEQNKRFMKSDVCIAQLEKAYGKGARFI